MTLMGQHAGQIIKTDVLDQGSDLTLCSSQNRAVQGLDRTQAFDHGIQSDTLCVDHRKSFLPCCFEVILGLVPADEALHDILHGGPTFE